MTGSSPSHPEENKLSSVEGVEEESLPDPPAPVKDKVKEGETVLSVVKAFPGVFEL